MRSDAIRRARAAVALAMAALPAAAQQAGAQQVGAVEKVVDKGDTAWLMVSAILVIAMSVPGLALFYGGLVRARNMLSVLMQVLTIFCVIALLWVAVGYSLAFSGAGSAAEAGPATPFIGGLSKAFLAGIGPASLVETFSANVLVPEYAFVIFQMAFACIAGALITGAVVERMKFAAVLLFVVIWFLFSYLPMAHMVWWWGGPSAHDAPSGYLFGHGALDFAGGTVIHINAGVAGLVAALAVGPRLGYGRELMAPHNLPFTFLGGCLLWVGWFGFNAGSNLEATGTAALAMLNTAVATAAAALAWAGGEWLLRGHPSLLGGISGAIAGLVAVTPAAGFVAPMGAIAMGLVAGFACMWVVISLKARLGIDESLDVFGIHGVGGIIGALLTGVFAAPSLGGTGVYDYAAGAVAEYDIAGQVLKQALGVLVAVVWSALVSLAAIGLVRALTGLRVATVDERQGLDITTHGESAYNG